MKRNVEDRLFWTIFFSLQLFYSLLIKPSKVLSFGFQLNFFFHYFVLQLIKPANYRDTAWAPKYLFGVNLSILIVDFVAYAIDSSRRVETN